MPTATRNAGTEAFTDFEERRYQLRVVSCKETTSPPPDNRAQYEWQMALEGSSDPESGREITRKMWCSTIWNETAGKESHLVLIARSLLGADVTFEDWEALSFDDLVGKRGSAMVALDGKGYPAIDKTTFRPAGRAAAARQLDRETGEVITAPTGAPKRPAPPPRPQPPTAGVRTDEQRDRLLAAASEAEYDLPTLTNWIAQEYPGKDLDTITGEQAEALIDAAKLPF